MTAHALQLRGSLTTGQIALTCPCQADPLDSRSPARWVNQDGRAETSDVFAQHLTDAEPKPEPQPEVESEPEPEPAAEPEPEPEEAAADEAEDKPQGGKKP